ncbi:hypothetical protein [Streptomyces tailanensis]|uniref:hypothetical protein n=1 Tax=Streptomyces tailanensis TaxID=2569858 RepID=UPI001FEC6B7D|nr:hypothetical protein [Streptomyces tailanensis]
MADEQYMWLDPDAAERLLRGEPLEAVDADTRAQADRLAGALGALAAEASPASPPSVELPGEEAALAAFRSARTARVEDDRADHLANASTAVADAGLVRLGRTAAEDRRARWGRPARFGLAAALTAGMLGGVVAVAAGAGALLSPSPDDEAEPSVSISAAEPDQPFLSPSPSDPQAEGDANDEARGEPTPQDTLGGSAQDGDGEGGSDDGTGEDGDPDTSGQNRGSSREWWNGVVSACRDVRDGKGLDADRRRGLEDAAGGRDNGQLKKYCDGLLSGRENPGAQVPPGTSTGGDSGTSDSAGSLGGVEKDARSGLDSDDDDEDDSDGGNAGSGKDKGKDKGNGKGNGTGSGGNKGGRGSGGNKGGKGSGGNDHRGQSDVVKPIGGVPSTSTHSSSPAL